MSTSAPSNAFNTSSSSSVFGKGAAVRGDVPEDDDASFALAMQRSMSMSMSMPMSVSEGGHGDASGSTPAKGVESKPSSSIGASSSSTISTTSGKSVSGKDEGAAVVQSASVDEDASLALAIQLSMSEGGHGAAIGRGGVAAQAVMSDSREVLLDKRGKHGFNIDHLRNKNLGYLQQLARTHHLVRHSFKPFLVHLLDVMYFVLFYFIPSYF
jgi:hypothetical protein